MVRGYPRNRRRIEVSVWKSEKGVQELSYEISQKKILVKRKLDHVYVSATVILFHCSTVVWNDIQDKKGTKFIFIFFVI